MSIQFSGVYGDAYFGRNVGDFFKECRRIAGIKVPDLHIEIWALDLVDDEIVKNNNNNDTCISLCGAWVLWTEINIMVRLWS